MTRTLTYTSYSDPEFLERERANLLDESWQYVGNLTDLPTPSSSFPTEVNRLPVVATRTEGEVNVLVNVCAHRGTIVCETPSTRDTLVCPYHAWKYDLSGRLLTAPRSEREPDFEVSQHHLETLPVGLWGPFIFTATSTDARPFDEWIADLPDQVKATGIDVESLQFHSRVTSDLNANWKVCVENFLECYHCRVAHPGFAKTIDTSPEEYHLLTAPTYSTQLGPVRERWTGSFDPRGEIERGQFHLMLPNTVINILPGQPNLSIGPITPTGPATTHRSLDYFFGPEVPETWIEEMLAFDNQVGVEDTRLVEMLQKGLSARPRRRGTLFMDSEQLIAHFEDHLRDALGLRDLPL
ncbi:MAG: aromatic ring-hydroxylating dioxygenase subunit alpha [Acidimicrobiia bacterium]